MTCFAVGEPPVDWSLTLLEVRGAEDVVERRTLHARPAMLSVCVGFHPAFTQLNLDFSRESQCCITNAYPILLDTIDGPL